VRAPCGAPSQGASRPAVSHGRAVYPGIVGRFHNYQNICVFYVNYSVLILIRLYTDNEVTTYYNHISVGMFGHILFRFATQNFFVFFVTNFIRKEKSCVQCEHICVEMMTEVHFLHCVYTFFFLTFVIHTPLYHIPIYIIVYKFFSN